MEFKNQWDTDDKKSDETGKNEPTDDKVNLEKAVEDSNGAAGESPSATDTTAVDLEKADIGTESNPKASPASSVYPSPTAPTYTHGDTFASARTEPGDSPHKARRFLIAYVTTVFSALSILFGTAWLGYVLFDHFFGPKTENGGLYYFDLAPLYISIMASLIVFGAIYIIASRYVAKSASNDTIGLKDWRAYKVVYAFFSALLIATGASIIAGLVYIPLAQLMIADDLNNKQILVQVTASFHALAWIAVLIWQERLVKKAKQSWLQGFVVVAGVALVVLATGLFPVGSKTDERHDKRVASDLSTLEQAIQDYKSDNKSLPTSLSALKFEDADTVKNRLSGYKYTIKNSQQSTTGTSSQQKVNVKATVFSNQAQSQADDSDTAFDGTMTDEEYYNALYESMYSNSLSSPASKRQTYELCATFRTDTTSTKNTNSIALLTSITSTSGRESFHKHKSGEVCFTRS